MAPPLQPLDHGGAHTLEDFAAHTNDWVTPLALDYRGYTVHEIPPNGQGIAALIALGILEHFDLASQPVDSPEVQHLEIEARADYDALQLNLRRRLTNGFGFTAAYTWSKAQGDFLDHLADEDRHLHRDAAR